MKPFKKFLLTVEKKFHCVAETLLKPSVRQGVINETPHSIPRIPIMHGSMQAYNNDVMASEEPHVKFKEL